MALFSFGKKDKKPPEVADPLAKTQPTPPKIQSPPSGAPAPAVKPPQPTGMLLPGLSTPGSVTTQPMGIPRPGVGLKPVRAGTANSTRSTQRIVLPTPPGARAANTKSLSSASGRINLPIGMILRCLPPEVLSSDISEFEANGSAATEIGLPMNMILGQLPSGKVEMTLQELIPHFPPGYLQATEAIAAYLPQVIILPLMDVVMRIPPDLLALRPDQKDVDASVINMADPFTEEILREQAEAARRQSQPNIIEESQVPQEEFVPRDQAASSRAIETVAPPRRPTVTPLSPTRTAATTLAAPPMPPVAKLPTPPTLAGPRASQVLSAANATGPVRSFSTPTPIPVPPPPSTRASVPLPAVPLKPQSVVQPAATPPSSKTSAPIPPVPRHTGPIPAPPPPRHTTAMPVPRRTGSIPAINPSSTSAPVPAPATEAVSAETTASNVAKHAPDAAADDLQRLAALAMVQMGEDEADVHMPETPAKPEASSDPVPLALEAPAAKPEPAPAPTPASVRREPVATTPEPALVAAKPEPVLAPEQPPAPAPVAAAVPVVEPAAAQPENSEPTVAFNINTCSVDDLVQNISGCSQELAEALIKHRSKIGSFKKLEDLLDVPGMTKAAFTNLTGEEPPAHRVTQTVNELLNFPATQQVSLKDVTDRILCWPDVNGCLLSQSSGLSLVGTAPEGLDKEAIVAFVPRMFESINKSFSEVSGHGTDALLIPSAGTSFHLFHNNGLYLIIMSRLPQMPERHMKVARLVLAALAARN